MLANFLSFLITNLLLSWHKTVDSITLSFLSKRKKDLQKSFKKKQKFWVTSTFQEKKVKLLKPPQ